jgi:hypothetical protein
VILNLHASVVLVLSILEDLCLPRDFKFTCISGVSVVHSGGPMFIPCYRGPPEWTTLTPLMHEDLKSRCKDRSSRMDNTNTTDTCTFKSMEYVHVLVVLMLFILEDLCLRRDFKCACTSGVSVVHSGGPLFTP